LILRKKIIGIVLLHYQIPNELSVVCDPHRAYSYLVNNTNLTYRRNIIEEDHHMRLFRGSNQELATNIVEIQQVKVAVVKVSR
jgi:hypothetical protein